MHIRRTSAALTATAALSLSGVAVATPAHAAIFQDGLVNVAIETGNIQVPVSVAATVCGVSVAVLSAVDGTNDVACTTTSEAIAQSPSRQPRR